MGAISEGLAHRLGACFTYTVLISSIHIQLRLARYNPIFFVEIRFVAGILCVTPMFQAESNSPEPKHLKRLPSLSF